MYRYVSEWRSDDLTRDSSSSGEESKNIRDENDSQKENRQSSLPFINVVNVSSYSPDSNSTRRLTDASADSEIEMGYDVNAAIDLRLRIRKFDEENASLREELLRAEDVNISLQQQINSLNRRVELLTLKNKNLQKEIDEQKELLSEAEEREKSSKLELQKTLKEKAALETKLESVQKHDESINGLKTQIAQILQEKKQFKKQYDEYQNILKDKCAECDSLKGTIVELEDSNNNFRQACETSIQYLREKNQELLNQNLELQIKSNNSGSERLSITPPFGYINSYMHSTPYTTRNISPRRSLYAELKASGFSPERTKTDSKIAELEEELSLCNQELSTVSEQMENAIQRLASVVGQKPYIPNLNLENENSKIPSLTILKREIAVLMNLVSERVRKSETKDSSLQVAIEGPKFRSQFSGSIENESLALSESSMTSLFTETNRESEKGNGCSSGAEVSNVQRKSSQVQVQENSIIKPIVEALDQIIRDSIDDDSSHQKFVSTRNHKRRCIYTYTRPPTPNPELIITPSIESPVSIKNEKPHYVTSKGDAPEITSKKAFNPISQIFSKDIQFSPQITMQPSNISTRPTFEEEEERKGNKADATYCITPTLNSALKSVPRRKLSVFQRSFDIESLQVNQEKPNNSQEEKEYQASPSVQEKDQTKEENLSLIEKNSVLNTYRSVINNSESSDSTSPDRILCRDEDISELEVQKPKLRPIIIAPTKLILPQKMSKFEETKIISKDVNQDNRMQTDFKVFENVTVRKKSESNTTNKEGINLEKDLKSNGDVTFSKVSIRKYCTVPDSSLLFNSMERIDATINIDNSSICFTNQEGKANIDKEIVGVAPPIAEACSANSDNSGAVETGNEIVNKITPSVVTAMSSAEDSSDSECDRINSKGDRQVAVSDPLNFDKSLDTESQHKTPSEDRKLESEEKSKNQIREKVWMHKRSLSDSKSDRSRLSECQCHSNEIKSTPLQAFDKEKIYPKAFPSLTDDHLQESGIANFSDLKSEYSENLSEDELEKKYTTFSVGLRTDRMTLSRRLALSQRQRDQSERNLTTEVEKMHQDIQDLAPLCTDRESLERIERVRLQLEMITQCAHRVSCVAETLGAVHQERRVSRAALLADRYLQLLKTRCEKLASEINETKRILMENNIVIEEHPSELGDDIPRIRYRAVPTNNRTMMARRRASIAAISRPLGSQQDLKEGTRQRNSVSGRVTLRRPSLNYETQKWENDKLVRTDSSSEIFEQAESRRNSREENNNVIRNSTSYLISTSYEAAENEIWSHPEEDFPQEASPAESLSLQHIQQRKSISSKFWTTVKNILLHPVFWYMLISFFFGVYMKHVFSSKLCVGAPFKWWSLEEIFESYIHVKRKAPMPI